MDSRTRENWNLSGAIHPSIGFLELRDNGIPTYIYRPGMALPDPADTRECMKFVGLSDEKIIEVEQRFNELCPDFRAPSCAYDEEHTRRGYNRIIFPVIQKMVDIYIRDLYPTTGYNEQDYAYINMTYRNLLIRIESYIKKGIQLELRPNFAIFCGLHKDDPRAIDMPRLLKKGWFNKGPEDLVIDAIVPFWLDLQKFMEQKLIHDGKAWSDDHGQWLIHEGETMDQAKARVDDRERQRLREEAIKKFEAEREQKKRNEQGCCES